MRTRLHFLSYAACTMIAFLTLGRAPSIPAAKPRDLCVSHGIACLADSDPQ